MTLNSVIFIISLIMTVFVTAHSFVETKKSIFSKISISSVVLISVLGIYDMFSGLVMGLNNYYMLLAVYMLGLTFFRNTIKTLDKNKDLFLFLMKLFSVLMILELYIFNFNSYHIIFGDYPEKYISSDGAEIVTEITNTTDITYSFKNINENVGTITIDAQIVGTNAEFMFEIGVSDETSEPIRAKIARIWAVPGYPETAVAPMHFSGEVSQLDIKYYLPDEQDATLKGIYINRPIAVNFSILRFLLIGGSLIFIYFVINGKIFNSLVGENKTFFRTSATIVTIFSMLVITLLMVMNRESEDGIVALFQQTTGDQMTQELVDAFLSGHTYMTFKPSEEILAMENPYDYNMRKEIAKTMPLEYSWDHLLYEGKYYSYYGIAPVILLFLPYHLITGYYFPAVVAVYIFSMIGIFSLLKVYVSFVENWFKDLKVGMAIIGAIIMASSCGIYFSMARPHFYETAISAGFACVTSGAYFFINSGVLQGKNISLKKLCISTILLSLGVLSRPTTAVYSMCAFIFILMGVKFAKVQFNGKVIKYILSGILPFVIIGSVQMIYNYVRFKSPFDFGIQYSLTINDFTKSQYHTQFVFVTIYNFILNVPSVVPEFPFVSTKFQALNTNGYYFKDAQSVNAISVGLLYRATPIFAYLMSKRVYKLSDSKDKNRYATVISLLSIIAPFVILFSIWESGYAVRYTADFSWQVLIGAYVVLFTAMTKCKNSQNRKFLSYAFLSAMFISLLVNFAQIYSFFLKKGVSIFFEEFLYVLENIFEFWC